MGWDITGIMVDAKVDHDKVVIKTTDGVWDFTPYGDCCANAYIHEPKDAQADLLLLKGQKVLKCTVSDTPFVGSVGGKQFNFDEESEYESNPEARDVHFYNLQAEKGFATITLYVDHNGYYGGDLSGGKI